MRRKALCWGCNKPQAFGQALFFCSEVCYHNTTNIKPNKFFMRFMFTLSALKLYKEEKL